MPDSSWLVSFTRESVSFSILRRNMMIFLTKMADAGVLAIRIAIPINVAHLQLIAGFTCSIAHATQLLTVVLMQAKCIYSWLAVVYVDPRPVNNAATLDHDLHKECLQRDAVVRGHM